MRRTLKATLSGFAVLIAATFSLPTAVAAHAVDLSPNWPRAVKVSDAPMSALASAVDSTGHVHVVGAEPAAHSPLLYLTNASGRWVQTTLVRPAAKGAINRVGIAIDVDDSVWIVYTLWQDFHPCGFDSPNCHPNVRDGTYLINNAADRWSRPREVPNPATKLYWDFAVRDGRAYFAYNKYSGDDKRTGEPRFFVWFGSYDRGRWESRKIGRGWGPYLAIAANGDPWIAFTQGGPVVAHRSGANSDFNLARAPYASAVVSGFDLDAEGRPNLIVYAMPPSDAWTSVLRLDGDRWTTPRHVVKDTGTDYAVEPNGRIHWLKGRCSDTRYDGLYYGLSTARAAQLIRIDRSDRCALDGPGPAATLSVDRRGRPHVVFEVWNPTRVGTWYRVGFAQD